MVHEIGHMFGLRHCIYFSCIMNGSNHSEENRDKPMELCPVCVRKLHENIHFDFIDRYASMAQVCKSISSEEFQKDSEFYENLAEKVKASYGKHYGKSEK